MIEYFVNEIVSYQEEQPTPSEWRLKRQIPNGESYAGEWEAIELATSDEGILNPKYMSKRFSLPSEKALDIQIGGDHYKTMPIQPMEYSMKNGLDACQHTIIKYVTRFREKGGIEDLEKAKHCIDLLIGFERGKE